MIKRLFVFFLLAIPCSGLLAQNYTSYTRHFLWNPDSSIVYAEPTIKADTLSKLPYGQEVKVLERLQHLKSRVRIGSIELAPEDSVSDDGYYLPGYWVKVGTIDKKIQGYVFSGEVINFPPLVPEGDSYGRALETYSSFFGVNIKEKESQKPVVVEGETYNVYETLIQFPEGSYRKTEMFDGCFDHEYFYKDKSLAQVYFLFIANYYSLERISGYSYGKPEFDYTEGEKLNFVPSGTTAADGLFIDIDEDGKITFGSYDCT